MAASCTHLYANVPHIHMYRNTFPPPSQHPGGEGAVTRAHFICGLSTEITPEEAK